MEGWRWNGDEEMEMGEGRRWRKDGAEPGTGSVPGAAAPGAVP